MTSALNLENKSSNSLNYREMTCFWYKKSSNTVFLHITKGELNTPTVMKHLSMDKYYWGEWEEGAPVG